MKKNLCAVAPLLTILITPHSYASDISSAGENSPAVTGPNAKVEIAGGAIEERFSALGGISFTTPLGQRFGAQIDAGFGSVDGEAVGGAGGHIFWRNPEIMLIGATGLALHFEDSDGTFYRAGAETEIYLDNLTLFASGGIQWDQDNQDGYGSIGAKYYATPNFALTAKFAGFDNYHNAQAEVEYRPEMLAGVSLFVNGGVDNSSNGFGMAGLRFSLGGSTNSLKERDRYDDPVNLVSDLMNASAKEVSKRTKRATASSTPSVSSGGGCSGSSCC